MTVHAPRVAVPSRYLRSKEVSEVPSGERGVHKEVSNDDELPTPKTTTTTRRSCWTSAGSSCARFPATDLGADARDAKLFNAFRVKISDVAASLLPGGWDPNASWRKVTGGGAGLNSDLFQPSGPRSLLPLLPPFGAEATALQALAPVPGRASMEISFRAGALRAALSPARMRQLEAVAAQMSDVGGDGRREEPFQGNRSREPFRERSGSRRRRRERERVGRFQRRRVVGGRHARRVRRGKGGEGIGPEGFVGPTAMGPLRYSRGRAHELARPLRLQG